MGVGPRVLPGGSSTELPASPGGVPATRRCAATLAGLLFGTRAAGHNVGAFAPLTCQKVGGVLPAASLCLASTPLALSRRRPPALRWGREFRRPPHHRRLHTSFFFPASDLSSFLPPPSLATAWRKPWAACRDDGMGTPCSHLPVGTRRLAPRRSRQTTGGGWTARRWGMGAAAATAAAAASTSGGAAARSPWRGAPLMARRAGWRRRCSWRAAAWRLHAPLGT